MGVPIQPRHSTPRTVPLGDVDICRGGCHVRTMNATSCSVTGLRDLVPHSGAPKSSKFQKILDQISHAPTWRSFGTPDLPPAGDHFQLLALLGSLPNAGQNNAAGKNSFCTSASKGEILAVHMQPQIGISAGPLEER